MLVSSSCCWPRCELRHKGSALCMRALLSSMFQHARKHPPTEALPSILDDYENIHVKRHGQVVCVVVGDLKQPNTVMTRAAHSRSHLCPCHTARIDDVTKPQMTFFRERKPRRQLRVKEKRSQMASESDGR